MRPSTEPPDLELPRSELSLAGVDGPPLSAGRRFARRLFRQRIAVIALAFLAVVAVLAITAPWLPLHNPQTQDLGNRLLSPSWSHPLGTDQYGRDMLARMIVASRLSLFAALEACTIAFALAVPLGIAAGLLRGVIDILLSRLADALLSLPFLVIAIAIVGILGGGVTPAMVAVGVLFSPGLFRLVRGAVLSIREETFIDAAFAVGDSKLQVGLWHVLPNVFPTLIVQASILMGFGMLAEASLSFLGLGISLDDISWGSMVGTQFSLLRQAPQVVVPPGLAIVLCVMAFNVLGDGFRDALGRTVAARE
jgi:peptide/nickel transport system permease protein